MRALPSTVAQVLDRVLEEDPDRAALVAPDRTLSYAELDAAADQAAAALRALGVAPGDRLAVSLPNDSRIVVLFHGAMRLGALWVGLNRNLSPPEQSAILADCTARLAIGCTGSVRGDGCTDLDEAAWAQAVAAADPDRPGTAVDPSAPAAIAYTSGTTGRPKGVVHSQHNLLVPGAVLVATRGYDAGLRKADCLPLTILNLQVLSTLLASQAGGTSVISDIRDAVRIAPWLRSTGATVWNGVPPQLYDLAHDPAIDASALEGLAEIWSGGDNLSEDVRRAFTSKFAAPICGTYGLTEAPTIVSIEDRSAVHQPGCSGVVLPHLQVMATAADGRRLPDGELGELCVSSAPEGPFAGLYTPMLGYWNDAEASAATLADGLLHTGDVGRVTHDGQVCVYDRRKLVIVRGGANVYPAEIERLLQTVPGVVATAVVGVPDERLGARVAAVVQVTEPGAVEEAALTERCRAELSRYKVPERWYLTATPLPRNAMGKIDRLRLAGLLDGPA
jgi:acyl-CoA synthetase (AMP-forming)/AMP-acid ligase II